MAKQEPTDRKPRMLEVRVAFDGPVTIAGMTPPGLEPLQFFGSDGEVIVPRHVEVGIGHERKKPGLKVLNRRIAEPTDILRDPTEALMRFKTVLAVDTNTREINGARISVTACVLLLGLRGDEHEPGRWHATLVEQLAYEFHDARVSPELVGWCHALQLAISTPVPVPAALIVDSELGRLSRFNRREEEILDGYTLPAGFELVFATRDGGATEFATNAALAACDRRANSILDRIECDPAVREWKTSEPASRWVTRHRAWTNEK